MRDLLKSLELKYADLLVKERLLRNTDINHQRNAHKLQQIRNEIKSLEIQMDMIDILRSIEREIYKKGAETHATEKREFVR